MLTVCLQGSVSVVSFPGWHVLCQYLKAILFSRTGLFSRQLLWGSARGKWYCKWLKWKTATVKCNRTIIFSSLPAAVSGILRDTILAVIAGGELDVLSRVMVNLRGFAKFPAGIPAKAAPWCKHSCSNIPAGSCMRKCWQEITKFPWASWKDKWWQTFSTVRCHSWISEELRNRSLRNSALHLAFLKDTFLLFCSCSL